MRDFSAGLLIIHNENILLVQQSYDKTGTHLSIPKGEIIEGELPITAAIRETYEETGIVIPMDFIEKTPYLFTIRCLNKNRHVIYFIVKLSVLPLNIHPIDNEEIEGAWFFNYQIAEKRMQVSQLSVLLHIHPDKLPSRALDWLLLNDYISKDRHPFNKLVLYNYTNKCKRHQFWNEITLWCRGLIADNLNNIRFRPLKKFFEVNQLYEFFLPDSRDFELYEKKDGTLGILYWFDGIPYITTRGSFTSMQAIVATALFYFKYGSCIKYLDSACSYYFEIVLPEDKHIVNYESCRDLFLIGAFNNTSHEDLKLRELCHLPFPKVRLVNNSLSLGELQEVNSENEEGYVALFSNDQRIKIKFQSYKEKYAKKKL